jgi:pyruvate, water dikinase
VKRLIQMVIAGAHKKGRQVGICGQAPSDYPEFAEYLVKLGIDSVSLNPDSLAKVAMRIATRPAEC